MPRITSWLEDALTRNKAADGGNDFANLLRQAILVLLAHNDPYINSFLERLAASALLGPMEHPCAITWAQTLCVSIPSAEHLILNSSSEENPHPTSQ